MTPRPYWAEGVGLADRFTPLSSGLVNVNTASATQLQLIPGIDDNLAHAMILSRAGPDGVDGSQDDMPFRHPGKLGRGPGLPPVIAQRVDNIK